MKASLISILLPLTVLAGPNPVPEALARAKDDLAANQKKLASVRDEIGRERPEVAREFAEVEKKLREKRRLARIARMSREDRLAELDRLSREKAIREQDATYLAGLLKDHALKVDTVSGPGTPRLEVEPGVLARDTDDPAAALTERLIVVGASLDRLEALLGGSRAPGKAVTEDGRVLEGEFAAVGPAVWFKGTDGTTGGVRQPSRSGTPRLWKAGSNAIEDFLAGEAGTGGENGAIEKFFAGQEVLLRVDVTGGKARTLEKIRGGAWDYIRKGGLWIWPILLLATVAVLIGAVKFLSLLRYREPRSAWVRDILEACREGDQPGALAVAARARHPAGPVLRRLLAVSRQDPDVIEENLYEQLIGVRSKISSLLPILAVTAATAPLLGLLGTVSGMIRTFNLIALYGSGDPKPLASGISEALITTLFGLAVAIPTLILHAFLSRRSQGLVEATERHGLSFINGLREQ
ncbi:MAG: hypothetical protein CMO40_05835 [Verrucomicrobiaceae bacterium]|nr:hypothetical protein [Verrucomicrobiaceae bacterium]